MRKQPSASSQWKLPLWVPTRLPLPASSPLTVADEYTLSLFGEDGAAGERDAMAGSGFRIWDRPAPRRGDVNVTARCDTLQAAASITSLPVRCERWGMGRVGF
jgi:hypothetical protein